MMMKRKDYLSDGNDDSELELGLGLSLGGSSCGGGGVKFLTAQDLPSVVSGSTATKTHSSLRGFISGTKRASDSDSHDAGAHHGSSSTSASQVVGWPPLPHYRTNNLSSCRQAAKSVNAGGEGKNSSSNITNTGQIDNNKSSSKAEENSPHLGFVKVNMDGVQIGRKIDLNAHSCYESLAHIIEDMFFSRPASSSSSSTTSISYGENERIMNASKLLLDGSSEFVLTYEDREGDWMLVGDVPWRMFLSNVKRLRIMRTSEANGLGPRFQERNDRLGSKPI